ncbi:MAG: 1,4-dihydroxy-2-naphthoate octaprenyltransferase [Methanomassiliicoccales archaeon PtaU1.Bin124]|nr:MAG: 1,4-dihydroxy-2-naphthoate octaprenyltransferase [Methanomassiliicoccales archaeon PtaU1.Bin124]
MQFGQVTTFGEKVRNVFRISYTLPFVFAALTGVAFAWTIKSEYLIGILILLDVFLLALFVNISNDYFDHRSGADKNRWKYHDKKVKEDLKETFNEKFFWEGNAFDRGIVTDRTGQIIIVALAVCAAALAIPILLYGGWMVVAMGAVAFFLSYFYTAPPLNLGARGLGEVDVFLSFTLISMFSYLVLVPEFSWEMMFIALTVGLVVMLMRVVDQMFGYEAHLEAKEKDFSVRFGREGAAKITLSLLCVIYAIDLMLVLFFNVLFVLAFLTIPLFMQMRGIFANKDDEYRWIKPVVFMLKTAMGQELLLVIAMALSVLLSFHEGLVGLIL